jgi:hypothetical protein
MMLDQIRKDQTQIIKDKDAWIKECEDEIARLDKEKEQIKKEKQIWEKRGIESAKEVALLKGSNNALKKQLQNIIVSDDPGRLIDGLNKRGLTSIRRRGSRSD